jgi:glycosyltransferase involved in cell wall biosynthesis
LLERRYCVRIGINALYLLPGQVGGSEIYIRNLVKSLSELDRDNTYVLFINRESKSIFQEAAPHLVIVPCPIRAQNRPLRILWEQFVLPFQVRRFKLDILLSAGMTSPFFSTVPSILVIYDLQHVNQPQNFSRLYLFFLKTIIYLSAKTADGIITISDHVKKDIIKHYKIEAGNITVAHLGVSHTVFFPRNDDNPSSIMAKYNLPEHYLLYTAALLPHKNHERLLRAFKEIVMEMPGTKLVLTGAWEKGQNKTADLIAALGLIDDVIMLGWIPFDELPSLYRGAEIFIYPSLHEGFGLPVLEAMASGVPVICSRIEPLLEIAGGAAFLVDPYDQSDIARGMLSVYRDKALRLKLVGAGIQRAKTFSWERTAINTLDCLNTRTLPGETTKRY